MLNLYRRHKDTCKLYGRGQSATNCTCPIWITGTYRKGHVRQSLDTKDWYHANTKRDAIQNGDLELNSAVTLKADTTVTKAINDYLNDCEIRGISPSSIRSYTITLESLAAWIKSQKLPEQISKLDLTNLDAYRAARSPTCQASTQRKEIIHLRTFFGWCLDRELVPANHAKKIRMPKGQNNITMPLTEAEINKLTGALRDLPDDDRIYTTALLYTLLYSGLRISDVAGLERSSLGTDGRLLLRMEKTGNPVYVKLPAKATEALAALSISKHKKGSKYFFYDGRMLMNSAINQAREAIARLGDRANVNDVHPHRFRDTFAITLLLNGVDIRTVQLLLGHESLSTTEKHYAPYVREFQVKLDAATDKLNF